MSAKRNRYQPKRLGGPHLAPGARVVATEADAVIDEQFPGPLRGVVHELQDQVGRLHFTVDQDSRDWGGMHLYAETWEAEPA